MLSVCKWSGHVLKYSTRMDKGSEWSVFRRHCFASCLQEMTVTNEGDLSSEMRRCVVCCKFDANV